ncbi:MAG: cobalt transporter subunit CbtA [Paracoccaceae bacterium]|jgi:cobalt transporter subunit CbtA
MFTRIVASAVFAGAGAGLIAALLQFVFVQPVLLHAELYESGQLVHFGAAPVSAMQDLGDFELMRNGLSVLFTMLAYTGYGFVVVAIMSIAADRGAVIDGRTGLLWGLAGFVAAHLAPAFSLPPEVPGVASGDVDVRQVWWFATVAAAAVAMWLVGFGKSWASWGAAAVLLLAPHLIGAPEPHAFIGPVPPEISALFAARALGVGLVAWALLGSACGYFWSKNSAN